jgi:hypothetical protein
LLRALDSAPDLDLKRASTGPAVSKSKKKVAVHFAKSEVVMYYYYRGYYHFWSDDSRAGYEMAMTYLQDAFDLLYSLYQCKGENEVTPPWDFWTRGAVLPVIRRNCVRVLKLLIPLRVLLKRSLPAKHLLEWLEGSELHAFYTQWIQQLRSGNVHAFDASLQDPQTARMLMVNDVFWVIEKSRHLILTRLLKAIYQAMNQTTRLPIQTLHHCFHLGHDENVSHLDQTECWLCVLIAEGYIKGYISHEHRTLVLSKTDPFPK